MPAALELSRVSKRFGRTRALDDLTWSAPSGAAVALLGPNGAGKTTLMRLCATLMRPTAGTLRVLGLEPARDGAAVRRRIAVLGHESYLYPDLSPRENLLFYARLFRLPDPAARAGRLIDELGLTGWSNRPVRTLSRGLLQRSALARVLLHDPEVLFLDEPFTGLDLDARDTLCAVLRTAHARGTTLLMSTHDLPLALALCDSALVLVGGRQAFAGAIAAADHGAFEAHYRDLTLRRATGAASGA